MGVDGSNQKKTVMVIGTGGTISCLGSDPFDLHDYPVSGERLTTDEMLAMFKLSFDDIDVVPSGFKPVSSTELGPKFWFALISEIEQAIRQIEHLAGIVVTHGTATLEESAFATDLLHNTDVPVVFTGAQRPENAISSDAPHNLWSAIQVAADPKARDRGVLVVMNGLIFSAADVSKVDNFALDAFQARSGPLGHINGRAVNFQSPPFRRPVQLRLEKHETWPRVEIIPSYAGADGTLIEATITAGAQGFIVAGLAPGYATPDQRLALRKARQQGIVVVMASRALNGTTLPLKQNDIPGLIGAGSLTPQKARILLALGLSELLDVDGIRQLFERFT
ncbi:asparaginase [Roseibium porphyridii]|uniref:Asparaginase n=1 Tax=Roseibium porphyridii TaxID=2866279 RepID=A0ABY8F2V2_9HYPH|nr:asparaginase [Roseibium sp. KMA01]WFE89800.1 asparaginase [Roseibium sp. KMA01]